MEVKIKSATISDLKDVQKLNLMLFEKEREEFDNTLDCEWPFSKDGENYFREHITEESGCVLIACIDDMVIGYLAGGLKEKDSFRIMPNFAELENMFVLDKYRNMGIGTKLYRAFIDWCKSKGVGKLCVIASAENSDGINFYRKNGFIDYHLVLEADI